MPMLDFTKMHGLGNDFVVVDLRKPKFAKNLIAGKARFICDRRFGAGCDQIITIERSRKADLRMRIFNADGSEVEMCGNGIRCFAKYLWDRKESVIRKNGSLDVETIAGIIRPRMIDKDTVEVDMGEPALDGELIPTLFKGPVVDKAIECGGETHRITAVSMGNPHCVIFTDRLDKIELEKTGSMLESHPSFPNRTNVEFVQVVNRNNVRARVWERGSGATLACGTGACAIAVASSLNKKTGRKVKVVLPGGTALIEWRKNNKVFLTGPAAEVYTGRIKI